MIAQAQSWWRARTPREKILLGCMAALGLILLLWLAVVRPLDRWVGRAGQRYAEAVRDRAEAKAAVTAIETIRARPIAPIRPPLGAFLIATARDAGFTDAEAEPTGNGGARLALSAVRAQAFFPWLIATSRRHGLIVTALSATPNSDRTLAVAVTIRQRGR